MGAYHAIEGFKTMSHAKGVFAQANLNMTDMFRPPYSKLFDLLLKFVIR